MASMNQRVLSRVAIPFPPTLDEERSIAEVLSDADALIDSLERLLTKKRQIKQGAMQELLTGKRRLPGFTGVWAACELRKLGHVVRGVAYNPGADLADGDTEQTVRLLRSNNVQGGEIVRSGLQFVNRRRVRSDQYLRDGDLLLCMANGSRDLVGKTGRFERADEHQYTFGAFMACYRPDPTSVAPELVAFLFQTHAFRQHIDLLLAGSSINNLRPEGVLGFTASIPMEPAEQVAIAQALTELDTEIATLESGLTKARALKQAMSQALLTGRIRLAEPAA
jgi:type I restriction enzyme S subunit